MAVEYHTQAGLNAYKAYIALKLHFTKSDFDFFKYGGKTSASFDSYKKRKDAIFFEMIGKHPDPVNFIAFNMAEAGAKLYPKQLATAQVFKQQYDQFKRQLDSLTYAVERHLKDSEINILEAFTITSGHPPIVNQYLRGNISLLILTVLIKTLDLQEYYDAKMPDPIWQKLSLQIKKLSPFLNYDPKKISSVLLKMVMDQKDT